MNWKPVRWDLIKSGKLHFLVIVLFSASLCYSQTPELVIPVGHKFGVRSATFSHDDKYVLSAGIDRSINLWEVNSGLLIKTLVSPSPVLDAMLSSDSEYIIAATLDGTLVWESSTSKLIRRFESGASYCVKMSADDRRVVIHSVVNDSSHVTLWDFHSGDQIRRVLLRKRNLLSKIMHSAAMFGYRDALYKIKLSSSGQLVIGPLTEDVVGIWDVETGELLNQLKHPSGYNSINYSPDGERVLTLSDRSIFIWDASTGELLKRLEVFSTNPRGGQAVFGPDTNVCLTTSENTKELRVWDIETEQLKFSIPCDTSIVSISFNKKEDHVVAGMLDNSVKVWGMKTQDSKTFVGANDIQFARLSRDRSTLAISTGESLSIFNLNSGVLSRVIEKGGQPGTRHSYFRVNELDFGVNGELAWVDGGGRIYITNLKSVVESQQPESKVVQHTRIIQHDKDGLLFSDESETSVFFDKKGRSVHAIFHDGSGMRWDASTGQVEQKWDSPGGRFLSIDSMDRLLVEDRKNFSAVLRDRESNVISTFRYRLQGNSKSLNMGRVSGTISPDGRFCAVNRSYDSIRVWDMSLGAVIRIIPNVAGNYPDEHWSCIEYVSEDFSCTPDGENFLSGNFQNLFFLEFSDDARKLIFPTIEGKSIVYDLQTDRRDTLQGFVQGVDWNKELAFVIEDYQLKIVSLKTREVKLTWIPIGKSDFVVKHPSGLFDASPNAMSRLHFVQGLDVIQFDQLKARYYEPQLLKKVLAGEDLRKVDEFDSIELPPDIHLSEVDDKGYITIDLMNRGGGIGEVSLYINGKEAIKDARKPKMNPDADKLSLKIFVSNNKSIVRGQENLIAVKAWNKGHWVLSRSQVVSYRTKEIEKYEPSIFVLAIGTSDYTGNEIDLKYAAKDADDVKRALELGGNRLFGSDKTHVYSLTTSMSPESFPTKTNILNTFDEISSKAHPLDVFVVYIAGHGINHGGPDGDWYYLTQDAYTVNGNAYNDPGIRRNTTLSSNELIELFKKVPALKHVLLIDACASGKVVDNLMDKRDIESSTLRALDRMRDRTGTHIITGCTADAVSYEASKFGQGILTYSLLEGIRGAALREGRYVDVNRLFQYAQERVPQLAEGIGGIQSPQVFSPHGAQSYDIGLLTDQEKSEIPIASIRPVYIRSNFIDDDQLEDDLQLARLIDESMNEVASRGANAPIVFVDVRSYPDGCKLSGRYKQDAGSIKLRLRKKCGNDDVVVDLSGSSPDELVEEILRLL